MCLVLFEDFPEESSEVRVLLFKSCTFWGQRCSSESGCRAHDSARHPQRRAQQRRLWIPTEMKDEESVDEGVEVTETTPESTGSDEAKDKATPERVGFRGWLRGTAQKVAGQGLRNVGAGVVNNVIWTAGNATKIAGSVLQRSGNAGFKDYQSLATHLESLIQMDKGKARIESVTYLSELLKSKAPNYESLASVQSKDVGSPAPVLVINDNAGADAPSSPQAKGAGAAVDESPAETPEPPFSLEDNPPSPSHRFLFLRRTFPRVPWRARRRSTP